MALSNNRSYVSSFNESQLDVVGGIVAEMVDNVMKTIPTSFEAVTFLVKSERPYIDKSLVRLTVDAQFKEKEGV